MENLQPQIRFRGFCGDWENIQFKNLFKLSQGLQIPIADRLTKLEDNSYFYITNEFLNKNSKKKFYIKNPKSNYFANKDDILMTRTGNTGKVVTGVEGVYHNNFFKIDYNKDKNDKFYLYYLLNNERIQYEILNRAGTSTIPDLNHNDFNTIYGNFPKKEEQEKIGSLFEKLDLLIERQEKYLDLNKSLKKSLLQKLFPKEDECIPKIRFSKFENIWSKVRLYNFLKKPIQEKANIKDTSKIISVRLKLKGIKQNQNNNLKLGATQYYIRKKGQFIYGKQNIFNGAFGIIPDNLDGFASSTDIPALNVENLNEYFLFYYFSRTDFYKKLENISSGSGSKRVHEDDLLKLYIKVPSCEEQEKIGSLFKSLDDKIKNEEKKLSSYKALKKSLLQKIFV